MPFRKPQGGATLSPAMFLYSVGDKDDNSPLISRRVWIGVAWGAFIAASAAALAATGRFMFPNVLDEPNGRLTERQAFDASGLQFRPAANGWYTIAAVASNSPGADAGLRQEDLLLQIDEKDASQLTLGEIHTLLSRPGAICILRVNRLGSTRLATLKLKSTL